MTCPWLPRLGLISATNITPFPQQHTTQFFHEIFFSVFPFLQAISSVSFVLKMLLIVAVPAMEPGKSRRCSSAIRNR